MSADRPTDTARVHGVSERFRAAVRTAGDGDLEVLPTRLAQVACAVVGCDAAGLSVMSRDFRVPLGASGADATTVERLQFTLEQGPCWDAIRADLPLAANDEVITATWPQFAEQMHRLTPFRSIVSVPLRLARGAGGALDLHFADPAGSDGFDLDDATVVAAHIADRLNRADDSGRPTDLRGLTGPVWARGAVARGRMAVWIAVGMIIAELHALPADALAELRAAAFSAGRSLDDLAADIVEGRLAVSDLLTP